MKFAAFDFARLPKTYSGLVALHMPRPIHDKVAYDNAVEVVHALAGHNPAAPFSTIVVVAPSTMKSRYRLTRRGSRGDPFSCIGTIAGQRTSQYSDRYARTERAKPAGLRRSTWCLT